MIKSFRDLRVWQLGMELVVLVYGITDGFPKHELFGLTSQMRRSAVSVPSNIAEGHAREHRNEYLHHLSIAQASLAELETQLEIATRLGYLPADQFDNAQTQATALNRQLHALRNALKKTNP